MKTTEAVRKEKEKENENENEKEKEREKERKRKKEMIRRKSLNKITKIKNSRNGN